MLVLCLEHLPDPSQNSSSLTVAAEQLRQLVSGRFHVTPLRSHPPIEPFAIHTVCQPGASSWSATRRGSTASFLFSQPFVCD